jgi:hypothetical protein
MVLIHNQFSASAISKVDKMSLRQLRSSTKCRVDILSVDIMLFHNLGFDNLEFDTVAEDKTLSTNCRQISARQSWIKYYQQSVDNIYIHDNSGQ